MDNWCNVLKILFKEISAKEILSGNIEYQDVERKTFESLVRINMPYYSGNEAENLYEYASSIVSEETNERTINVLEVLRRFNKIILKEIEQIPVCRYRYLLKWRMVSFELEEDLFTTSFLAFEDAKKGKSIRQKFDWKYVIGNDNEELNAILKKGLAENHFHLKGSAPYFVMSWINLMNLVMNKRIIKTLKEYDKNRLQGFMVYHTYAAEDSLVEMSLQAALIRAYLYACMENIEFPIIDECYMERSFLDSCIDWEIWDDKKDLLEEFKCRNIDEENISLSEIYAIMLEGRNATLQNNFLFQFIFEDGNLKELLGKKKVTERGIIKYLWEKNNYINVTRDFIRILVKWDEQKSLNKEIERRSVYNLLSDSVQLQQVRGNLQKIINSYCSRGKKKYDYAREADYEENDNLFGERWFMYKMFRGIAENNKVYKDNGNLFYAYLVIKERIRSELIQVNKGVGFDNFLKYQNRKEELIEKTAIENIYSRLAVRSTFSEQNLLKFEARITPKKTPLENKKYINKLDKQIFQDEVFENGKVCKRENKELKDKFFYVFHFVKEPDVQSENMITACRHYKLRNTVKKQAQSIQEMRKRYPQEGSRVLGIDACSPEIGCRPEVFAQVYRYLQYEQSENVDEEGNAMPRLRSSYHVGEDFLDIIDGMRAIDEAVYYLNLTHGDRLGHALALGVSPREWYQFKGNRILCSRQDLLDNIVWLYHKIRKYNIIDTENHLLELERKFNQYYNVIYDVEQGNTGNINVYYDAWKLRGDNPYCYHYDGTLEEKKYIGWERYNYNNKYEELARIRKEKRCTQLFYRYHFDVEAKRRGRETVEFKITPELIGLVEKVQIKLQLAILESGLTIETNPSSNYLIGTFRSYSKHPIINWHNKKLIYDQELLEQCPQLDVTINTDDQAVFGTSLENEYALLAVALEKMKDEKGNLCYKKDMIYDWLDNIREIGLLRSFKKD